MIHVFRLLAKLVKIRTLLKERPRDSSLVPPTFSSSNRRRCTYFLGRCILYFKQVFFFRHYHSFPLELKQEKRAISKCSRACSYYVDRVSPLPVVIGDFLFWLVIFFGPVLSLKLQIELSGIH